MTRLLPILLLLTGCGSGTVALSAYHRATDVQDADVANMHASATSWLFEVAKGEIRNGRDADDVLDATKASVGQLTAWYAEYIRACGLMDGTALVQLKRSVGFWSNLKQQFADERPPPATQPAGDSEPPLASPVGLRGVSRRDAERTLKRRTLRAMYADVDEARGERFGCAEDADVWPREVRELVWDGEKTVVNE